eukprot:4686145-Amphidinium_carterae.2
MCAMPLMAGGKFIVRPRTCRRSALGGRAGSDTGTGWPNYVSLCVLLLNCLLYTSDAADDTPC